MGLDMNPLGKPIAGHKAEFAEIWTKIQIAKGMRPDPNRAKAGFFQRLFGSADRIDADPLIARLQEIMIPPFAAMNAPIVGQDQAADDWLADAFQNGRISSFENVTDAKSAFQGYHALEALPDCDGFPVYTHCGAYDGVDRTSFRGSFLDLCQPVIGKDLHDRAWDPMLAAELADWATALRARVDAFAKANDVQHVLGDKHYTWQDDTAPDAQAHIVDQAARWAAFWSDRGHGNDPYF